MSGFGVYCNSPTFSIAFQNCSFDYTAAGALRIGTGAASQRFVFTNCHLENCNNTAFVSSDLASNTNVDVAINNCTVLPKPQPVSAVIPATHRQDGHSAAVTELFKGRMKLSINGLKVIGYQENGRSATAGLFMIDTLVTLLDRQNVTFEDYRQLMSKDGILNYNYNFNVGTAATSLDFSSIDGWTFKSRSGITAELSTTQVFDSSTNSLRFTYTSGSNFYLMMSDAFTMSPNDRISFQNVLYGATSTGIINCQPQLIHYRFGATKAVALVSVTTSGTVATYTTAKAHNLSPNHAVMVDDWVETAYNGKKIVSTTPSPTTFTTAVVSGTSTPGTGTGTYSVEPLIPIFTGTASGQSFKTSYDDTGDPAYTGGRAWWAKQGEIAAGTSNAFGKPVIGATHGKILLTVSNLDASDVVYLGASIMQKT